MLREMAGFDPQRFHQRRAAGAGLRGGTRRSRSNGLRIGLLKEFFDKGLDPQNEARGARGAAGVPGSRRELSEVSLPHLPLSVPVYYVVAPAECSSNLARFDGVRFGHRCENPQDLLDLYRRSRGEGFGAEVKRRIMTGTYVLSAGYYDAYYLQAQKRAPARSTRRLRSRAFERGGRRSSGPTTPTPAFALGAKTADPDHHVSERHLHHRRQPRGSAGGVGAVRLRQRSAGRTAASSARTSSEARLLDARIAFQRDRLAYARCRGVTRERGLGNRHRAGDPRPARHRVEDLLRLGDRATAPRRTRRRTSSTWAIPACCRCSTREAVRMAVKFGLAIRRAIAHALGVRAQELLLPGPAQGLPDQPVRAADRRRGHARHRARGRHDQAHRHHARAPGGGCRASRCTRVCRASPAST